ncbi:MAG: tetratricopeptide repeat protein, partial [Terriglobales bacterium]
RNGHPQEAIANYREALKIEPNIPGLHFELAEMLNTSQLASDKEQAESEYKVALAVNQFDEKSECRLGDIAARKGDQEQALSHYTRAVQLQPNDPEADIDLAKMLMQKNQLLQAEPLLDRAVKLDPTSAIAHFRLGTLYRETGRTADAKRELDQFQKYKEMKEKLRDIYSEMRLEPAKQEQDQTDNARK